MNKSSKIASLVGKLFVFTLFLAIFMQSAVRAADSFKEEDRRVLSQIRLSLWYQGLENKEIREKKSATDYLKVEELRLPLEKYFKESQR